MAITGGKSFQDREKAAKVRHRALDDIYLILTDDPKIEEWSDLKKQVLLKMSTTILPRLNEHSGPDGGEIPIPIYGGQSIKNQEHNGDEKDIQSEKED